MLPQHAKHITESMDILFATHNPETFFSRLDFLNSESKNALTYIQALNNSQYSDIEDAINNQIKNANSRDMQACLLRNIIDDATKNAEKVKLSKTKLKRYDEAVELIRPYEDMIDAEVFTWFKQKIDEKTSSLS